MLLLKIKKSLIKKCMNQTDSLILKALKFHPKSLIEENGINLSEDVLLSPQFLQ